MRAARAVQTAIRAAVLSPSLTKSPWSAFGISHYLPSACSLFFPYPELLQASLEEKEECCILSQEWCRWCFFPFDFQSLGSLVQNREELDYHLLLLIQERTKAAQITHRLGNKWGLSASYCLSIHSKVDMNISHQVHVRKFTFPLQSIQNLPFKYHQRVSELCSKGQFPDRSHCDLLNTIRSQHSQLLAPDWAGNLLLQLIPLLREHFQGRWKCKVRWNCRAEAVHSK